MITVLEYLVIAAAIGAVVFVVAVFVFGRGERMAPLPAQTSPAELPDRGVTAQDVYDVKFAMALRGYRMSDVDWVLERLALRIEELSRQVTSLQGGDAEQVDVPAAAGTIVDVFAEEDTGYAGLSVDRPIGSAAGSAAAAPLPVARIDAAPLNAPTSERSQASAEIDAAEAERDELAYGTPPGPGEYQVAIGGGDVPAAASGPATGSARDTAPAARDDGSTSPGNLRRPL